MSRFGQLEFDGDQGAQEVRQGGPLAGEARCLGEGRAALERGEFEPGLRWYGRTLEHNPRSLDAWVGQVQCLIELGRFAEASQWADQGLERIPDAPDLLAAKAVALGRLGRSGEALPFSDAAVENPGASAYAWLARGDVLLAAGRGVQGDRCFEQALELAPGDWLLRWLAARARAFWRQFAAALRLIREAAALEPGRAVLWLAAGQFELELGLVEASRRSFGQALALQPESRAAEAGLRAAGGTGWLDRWFRRLRAFRGG